MVFGKTAMATDVRYQAFTGTDQEYYHQIICCASHKVTSIEELWLDQELAWSSTSGVASKFSGYLTVTAVLEGSSANAINIDANWNAAAGCRLTGCAYLHIIYKRTGATKDSDSPFASSITTRMTIIGKGIAVYDARFDSTRGGSGTMRADDQTTWAFTYGSTEIGRNPAAQISTFMLGWKIGGKLAVGCGMPANRISWSRMITSGNVCDEAVTLAVGGTEPRYRTDFIIGEGDDRGSTFGLWKASANALLRDAGGLIAFDVIVNDIASPIASFTEDDVLSAGTWKQSTPLTDYRNIVRGRYTDARPSALYQLVDWPQIALTSPDGIDRILSLDYPAVQSASQVQRLAKQVLQRLQAGGMIQLVLGQRAWALQIGDPMRLTFYPLGFVSKAFRVAEMQVAVDGRVEVTLTEEQSSFYAWSAEEGAPVTLPTPTTYAWQNEPTIAQLLSSDQGATRNVSQGVHSTSSTYVRGDIVRTADGLSSYIAKQAVPTSIALSNTAYWDLFVQGGGGTAGANAFQAMLTNTPITITTAADGSGGSYTAANGYMTLYEGAVNRSASSTYAVVGSPSWASINSTTGYYSITDPGADQASVQFDVSYSGVTYRLTLNVAKVRQGVSGTNGLNAKTLIVISDRQTIAYDGTGALSPSTQTTTFTAQKQNTTGTVSWTISDNLGNTLTPSTYLTATTGDTTSMTASNFSAAIAVNTATGVIVTGTISADSISDKISVVKVQAGAAGSPGAPGSPGATGSPGVSALTVTATPTNISVPCTFSGTPKAAIPGSQIKVFQAGSDVTASATYGTATTSGLSGASVNSVGAVTVSGMTADTGFIQVPVSYGGASGIARVQYDKVRDGAPYSANETTTVSTPTGSYAQLASVTLLAGPNGTFGANWQVNATASGSGNTGIDGYLEYSLNGSSWSTVTGSAGSDGPYPSGETIGAFGGAIFTGSSIGLSAKQTFYIRLIGKKNGGGTPASVSGSLSLSWTG
jgi:hypothetical protein